MVYPSNRSYLGTILTFFAISMPYIADLVLSILSYQEEYKTYYIIRFVTIGLSLCFIIILPFLLIWGYYEDYDDDIPVCFGIIIMGSVVYIIVAILPMEITSLVYFIRNYEFLFYLGKIGYYIHAGFFCLFILSFIIGLICSKYS